MLKWYEYIFFIIFFIIFVAAMIVGFILTYPHTTDKTEIEVPNKSNDDLEKFLKDRIINDRAIGII